MGVLKGFCLFFCFRLTFFYVVIPLFRFAFLFICLLLACLFACMFSTSFVTLCRCKKKKKWCVQCVRFALCGSFASFLSCWTSKQHAGKDLFGSQATCTQWSRKGSVWVTSNMQTIAQGRICLGHKQHADSDPGKDLLGSQATCRQWPREGSVWVTSKMQTMAQGRICLGHKQHAVTQGRICLGHKQHAHSGPGKDLFGSQATCSDPWKDLFGSQATCRQ